MKQVEPAEPLESQPWQEGKLERPGAGMRRADTSTSPAPAGSAGGVGAKQGCGPCWVAAKLAGLWPKWDDRQGQTHPFQRSKIWRQEEVETAKAKAKKYFNILAFTCGV
jgi:hypothetical protein